MASPYPSQGQHSCKGWSKAPKPRFSVPPGLALNPRCAFAPSMRCKAFNPLWICHLNPPSRGIAGHKGKGLDRAHLKEPGNFSEAATAAPPEADGSFWRTKLPQKGLFPTALPGEHSLSPPSLTRAVSCWVSEQRLLQPGLPTRSSRSRRLRPARKHRMPSLNRSGKKIRGNQPVLCPSPSGSVEHSPVGAVVCQHLLGLGQRVSVSFHLLHRGAVPSAEHTLLPQLES